MARTEDLVVGLDIGTTKIVALVGQLLPDGQVDILAYGHHPSRGLKKGVVVDIETTTYAIAQAIEAAEKMAGCEIVDVYAGIAGAHIDSFNCEGEVTLGSGEVRAKDLDRVLESARPTDLDADREVIHLLAQHYAVDGQTNITRPLGLSGKTLRAKVHVVTANTCSAENIVKCVERAGVRVRDIVLEQVASSEAVLTNEDRMMGTALIDIGGGTSDLAIWRGGGIVHTAVLPMGGDHLTHDIAVGLSTTPESAEKLKHDFGRILPKTSLRQEVGDADATESFAFAQATLEVPQFGGAGTRQVPESELQDIILARVEELFEFLRDAVDSSGLRPLLAGGVVLTGGTTLLPGMRARAEEILGLQVRTAKPRSVTGLTDIVSSPIYATGVGLVQYGRRHQQGHQVVRRQHNLYDKVKSRMRSWLGEFF